MMLLCLFMDGQYVFNFIFGWFNQFAIYIYIRLRDVFPVKRKS